MAEFRSQPVYLLGQFRNAGTYYLDRPLTLLQGLALGGGLLDAANLRSARLLRDGKTVPVDICQLIEGGRPGRTSGCGPGDTIFVPDDRNQNVFVFGAVNKPGPVPMPNGRLTLAQALAAAGARRGRAATGVRAHHPLPLRHPRRTAGGGHEADDERRGPALPAEGRGHRLPAAQRRRQLEPGDQEILPSLQAFSAILQPFVQIKFLRTE